MTDKERIEQLEVQLAGCMTAATGWAKDPPKKGDWGWSPAFQDVLELRNKYESLSKNGPSSEWLVVRHGMYESQYFPCPYCKEPAYLYKEGGKISQRVKFAHKDGVGGDCQKAKKIAHAIAES